MVEEISNEGDQDVNYDISLEDFHGTNLLIVPNLSAIEHLAGLTLPYSLKPLERLEIRAFSQLNQRRSLLLYIEWFHNDLRITMTLSSFP